MFSWSDWRCATRGGDCTERALKADARLQLLLVSVVLAGEDHSSDGNRMCDRAAVHTRQASACNSRTSVLRFCKPADGSVSTGG